MVAGQPIETYISPQEYDRIEAQNGVKYEWYDGTLSAMAGASPTHNTVAANILLSLGTQLRGRDCQPWGSDQRVWIASANAVTYPDVVVACPPHEWDDKHTHALRNPRAIIEVLSPSTEKYDQTDKWALYRTLPALHDYVLIATQFRQIQHYQRQDENWLLHIAHNDDDCVTLSSIDCRLCVSEVYERLELPDALTFLRTNAAQHNVEARDGKHD